jgi:hypothetical protein
MNTTRHVLDDPRTEALKPALASIRAACTYMGNLSRSTFYSEILPKLETVHVGTRHLIVVSSMDRLIARMLDKSCAAVNALPDASRGTSSLKSRGGALPRGVRG